MHVGLRLQEPPVQTPDVVTGNVTVAAVLLYYHIWSSEYHISGGYTLDHIFNEI